METYAERDKIEAQGKHPEERYNRYFLTDLVGYC
jgi:hypothetical protein